MLEGIIPSATRRKLLALFFLNSKNRYYVRELERRTGENISAVRRELGILGKAGLLLEERQGNMAYYRANAASPIFSEIRGIMLKTEGFADAIRGALAGKGARFAFIYGSYATGGERAGSDVDVMIIGDVAPKEIIGKIREAERGIGREINYSIYPEKEFGKELSKGFIRDVMKGRKVMLIGDEDGLERFAKGRQD
jgi:uncharacterized protein